MGAVCPAPPVDREAFVSAVGLQLRWGSQWLEESHALVLSWSHPTHPLAVLAASGTCLPRLLSASLHAVFWNPIPY